MNILQYKDNSQNRDVISLFSGAMGLDIGLEKAGLHIAVGQDFDLSGKDFWWKITGEENFYIKLMEYMGDLPKKYVARFQESYMKASNRLVREFSNNFCAEDGSIDWEKLVRFNSGE